ncbi:hypothetical protein HMPREF9598_02421 [Cutibacterium acnes HL050PA1]|nr:hypothetical protein HMPREF1034_2022 [Cutibacterium acnes SK187]EFS66289.1 hypothetical protein HMPREF9612_01215 [Cutibacterium acnes HL063PA2]EFS80921.1 hypothetical protein HMPREF9598_02421 [Cutibacterium acnes HL050PA1]EFS85197.1 hypothetical protein HMPREF9600_00495 [Cutibacterium acnes HL050PA3]EFT24521.1 hypothetical protein HMPREF9573_00255 [Cutibacterium acnes HL072PA2]EFT54010.1 hypothetical protein HMPREF9569_00494 [Cutibacterium acnes HL078PA1]EGF03363.1 hypothetical protein HMP
MPVPQQTRTFLLTINASPHVDVEPTSSATSGCGTKGAAMPSYLPTMPP